MLQKYNIYKVLSLFLNSPLRGFGWKEMSRELHLGPPSVKRYLDELKRGGLVVEKRVYGRKLYFANRESRKFKIYKLFDIEMNIENSGLIDFINKELRFPLVILFGSFASGDATEKSDIDIAVISSIKKEITLDLYEKKLKRPIQIFLFSKAEFDTMQRKNKELYNNILNGRILSGYLKVT
jgi:predicted nucleotidyltransferase